MTKYGYDALGRRITRTLPLGQVETMGYDLVGNLTSKKDFSGKSTGFEYDVVNRLTKRSPPSVFSLEGPVGWTYSATGRRLTMSDDTGTTTYAYDLRDRLLTKATPQGTLSYTRDAVGHVKTVRSDKTDAIQRGDAQLCPVQNR